MADPSLEAVFKAPFAEQVAAFRLRLGDLVPTARWDDMAGQAHDRAFMVAGAVRADLLADLGAAVDRAIAEGTGIEAFRRDFREIVARHGWHGWTGEGSAKGEAWRTRVIYRTNMRTTYMAGRRAQLVDGGYRWWVYRHSGALHPRLDHLSWDGLALPPDHPFWATHYPPNGWGCGCVVEGARTAAGIRRMGGDPDKVLPDGWDKRDPRTGAPKGIARGWDHSPGATVVDAVRELAPKLDRLPPRPAVDLIQSWLRGVPFARWRSEPDGLFPLACLPDAAATRIGADVRVAMLSAETMRKQEREHPELTTAEYAAAQGVIDAGEVIQDGERSLVFVREDAAGGHVLVVKATLTGQGLFITSFRRISGDAGPRARTIAQLRRAGARFESAQE